jgi:LysR family glycine cleavage system transcriptional activator
MKYTLPPMHTLRAFEALGRLLHFARAAEDVHLTPSAVSHQIRAIESFYATTLFRRNSRGVELTPAGERLMSVVSRTLQELSQAGASLRRNGNDRLSISVPPSFASRWLMPRMAAFLNQNPGIDFTMHSTLNLVDLEADEMDLVIRYGGGRWKGMRSHKLFVEQIFPVAAPEYLAQVRGRNPLIGCVLLHDDFQTWDSWFEETGTSAPGSTQGAGFNDSALLLQAAEAGQGVALGRRLLVADAIEAGVLVKIGQASLNARGSYYLVSSTHYSDSTAVAVFRQWIASQIGSRDSISQRAITR